MVSITRICRILLICLLAQGAAPLSVLAAGPSQQQHEITYAYFPMAVPVAVLGEVLKRDRILSRNLARRNTVLRFLPLSKGQEAVALLREQKLDALCFSDNPAVEASADGTLAIVGTIKQSYAAVVAPVGTRMTDLRQKRVGSVPGSTSHYALLQGLAAAGMTEKDLTLVMLEVRALPEALLQGRIDALAAWEPTPSALLATHPGRFALIYRQASYSYFILSRRLLEQHPAVADEIAAAILRAVRWLKQDQANLNRAGGWTVSGMVAFTGKPAILSPQEVAAITRQDLLEVPGAPLLNDTGGPASPLKRLFDFMQQQQHLPPHATWETLRSSLRPDFLRSLAARPGRYGLQRFDYGP